MSRPKHRSYPFVGSMLGTVIACLAATLLVAPTLAPVVAKPEPIAVQKTHTPNSQPLYRLSPSPPGADLTA